MHSRLQSSNEINIQNHIRLLLLTFIFCNRTHYFLWNTSLILRRSHIILFSCWLILLWSLTAYLKAEYFFIMAQPSQINTIFLSFLEFMVQSQITNNWQVMVTILWVEKFSVCLGISVKLVYLHRLLLEWQIERRRVQPIWFCSFIWLFRYYTFVDYNRWV